MLFAYLVDGSCLSMPTKPSSSISFLKILSAFSPVLIWAGVIFLLSSQRTLPGLQLNTLDFIAKKTAHIVEYCILFFLLHRALFLIFPQHKKYIWLIAFVLCLLYAISDEWHQSFVNGRTASARDVGFDMLGVSLAFLGIYRYI